MARINARRTVSRPLVPEQPVAAATEVSLKELFEAEPAQHVSHSPEFDRAKDAVSADPERSTAYTTEDFVKAWKNYCEVVKGEDNLSVYATLSVQVPEVTSDHVIRLEVSTDYQQRGMQEVRESLLDYVRKALQNDLLTLEVTVRETEVDQQQLYSDKDKYAKLVELNPALDDLRKKLGLDVEF